MKTALVVVDLQSYFLRRSPPDLPNRIAQYIDANNYDALAFTIFKNKDGSNFEKSLHWPNSKTPADLQISDELKDYAHQGNTFTKTSYSAFKNEEFSKYLKERQIERVEICGIDSDACVLATAFDAFDRNYEVEILFDLSYSRWDFQDAVRKIADKNLTSKNRP